MSQQTLEMFEKNFLKHCREKNFFRRKDRVLMAISGGMDSMTMAYFIPALEQTFKIRIGIAHMNHGLRGKSSDRDEAFVRQFARSHHYPYYHKKADVRGYAKKRKISIEEAARHIRYAFLDRVARENGYTKICTAHHAGDQVETVLMRIIKGAGLSGLTGIREKRGSIIRPMLFLTKNQIEAFVKKNKIQFRKDHTNKQTFFLRNRIRHDLIPYLKKKFDPQIETHLLRLGYIAEETHTFFKDAAKRQFSKVGKTSEGKIVLEIKAFNRYLRAQRQAIIELIFEKYFGQKLFFKDYQTLFDLIEKKQSGKKIVFGTVTCLKSAGQIVFFVNHNASSAFSFVITPGHLHRFENPGLTFKSTVEPFSPKIRNQFGSNPDVEYIDAKKIKGQLKLRNWKNGDRFKPLGMNDFKNLSDFFIDQKIPITEKKKIPVLCEKIGRSENIIWLCGLRLDDRYKIDKDTQHTLKLEWERHEKNH